MANGTNWAAHKNAYYVQWRAKKKQAQQNNQSGTVSASQQSPPQKAAPVAATVKYGGTAGPYGGHGSLQGLVNAMKQAQATAKGPGVGNGSSYFHAGEGNSNNDFTDNNNPALVKWQQQSDDTKTAKYLAKIGKQATPAMDAEGYAYHQSAYQNMVIDQNLNAPVYAKLDSKSFDAYCAANNLTPIYRGWAGGTASKARFEDAAMSHTGTGMYGEGYYFGDKGTASGYSSGAVTKAALSPNARVVDLDVVQKAIQSSGAQKAFVKSGHAQTGSFSPSSGEAQMALKMGYNVIRSSWSYVVLTRDAVVIRK